MGREHANRVLIVDDAESNRILLKVILQKNGFHVRTASGGEEALELVKQSVPDLVLLDVQMPDLDGYEVCQRFKSDERLNDVPVIFVSAETDEAEKLKAFNSGGDDYITKPFKASEVVARVEAHIDRHYYRRQMQEKNRALEKVVAELQSAQAQLVQSEKLASIGQLAAGVAHEINNPVGYVNSNLNTLKGYIDDIMSVIDICDDMAVDGANIETGITRYKQLKKDLEIDYLRQDIKDLLAESAHGLDRVKKIVQDLKDFSYVDRGEWEVVDVHAGIESTINVVWNELKYKTEVVREYGELPLVTCMPSQLNQVVMNLLINAAHAIEDRGVVTIRTWVDGDKVFISINDTGKGIEESDLKKIFDPFFTTKPVGKGTGLGLSLAYGIMEKHGGKIEVSSEVGKGTTFKLCLPIQQAQEAPNE